MDRAEFWVMRLWMSDYGATRMQAVRLSDMTAAAQIAALALLAAGKLAQLPGGILAEPVEVFDEEPAAAAHRELLMAKYPSEVFRVVLNVDVPT